MGKIRGTHSSPGVYTKFTDLSYAAQSLGITTLGLVGETKMGPAFEPVFIKDWNEFTQYFGGTSAEKFKDSLYPKYELPYIAKSYLKASDQLYVCRVLGLSGYNSGPAFVITASGGNSANKYVVAVLRSKGSYNRLATSGDICDSGSTNLYDQLEFECGSISLEPYTTPAMMTICGDETDPETEGDIAVSPANLGRFTIVCRDFNGNIIGRFAVSLNSGSKDYIYNVIGNNPNEGIAPVFVEELYDLRLLQLIETNTVDVINKNVNTIKELDITAACDPATDFVTIPLQDLTRRQIGQRYLSTVKGETNPSSEEYGWRYYNTDAKGDFTSGTNCMQVGYVYTVKGRLDPLTGKRKYVYVQLKDEVGNPIKAGQIKSLDTGKDTVVAVKVLTTGMFYYFDGTRTLVPAFEMSDYHESFRCATTPWLVSEIKGDGKDLQVKKLFRLHTISDGTSANGMIKVSIANIRPDEGLFDLYIRDFNDADAAPVILEQYRNITMEPGNPNYIGLRIGTLDGSYETVSKYVVAEIIDNDMTRTCVPCGFLGYPTRDFARLSKDVAMISPTFVYNTTYNEDIRERKQYFGLSDITGVDIDMLYYKGKNAYTEDYIAGYTNSFHLDSTLSDEFRDSSKRVFTIDGDPDTSAVTWTTVSPAFGQPYDHSPIIGSEAEMEGCLFEDIRLRKFTVYPCGGFDGWDIYRGSRTTGDEFKANKYKGLIRNGHGSTFSKIDNPEILSLDGKAITSDYYAYLAGANQFEIPEKYVINLFATPGIDYVNSTMLTDEIFDMIEDKRGDSLYVVTTPDKPFGATDAMDEMYTSADAAENLNSTGIDTYYGATYYPWVKYFDADNNIYINLPATKDVLRNMADVDNKKYPWYAPAGLERGNVECKKMHFFAKLEDEDTVYDNRINPLKTFSEDGVKVWGNKTMYTGDTPMNRVNVVRLMLYMRNIISKASRQLIFDPNDTTLADEFDGILRPILNQIKNDRGIVDYKLKVSQTPEQMDAHEMSATVFAKPTPSMEYIEINFVVSPVGVSFDDM